MRIHKKARNAVPGEIRTRIRPIRIAAKRQRQMMAIISNSENGPEDVEWIEEDELDLSGYKFLDIQSSKMNLYLP